MQLLSDGADPLPRCLRAALAKAGPERRQQTTGEGDALTALMRGEQLPAPVTYLHLSSFLLSALPRAPCWQEDMREWSWRTWANKAGQSCVGNRCFRGSEILIFFSCGTSALCISSWPSLLVLAVENNVETDHSALSRQQEMFCFFSPESWWKDFSCAEMFCFSTVSIMLQEIPYA